MVKPSIGNLVMVTILSVVGIWGFKALMHAFPVKGLADIAGGI